MTDRYYPKIILPTNRVITSLSGTTCRALVEAVIKCEQVVDDHYKNKPTKVCDVDDAREHARAALALVKGEIAP